MIAGDAPSVAAAVQDSSAPAPDAALTKAAAQPAPAGMGEPASTPADAPAAPKQHVSAILASKLSAPPKYSATKAGFAPSHLVAYDASGSSGTAEAVAHVVDAWASAERLLLLAAQHQQLRRQYNALRQQQRRLAFISAHDPGACCA